jgi:hypothetical protein
MPKGNSFITQDMAGGIIMIPKDLDNSLLIFRLISFIQILHFLSPLNTLVVML